MSAKKIEVWIEFASTYSHIAVQSIESRLGNSDLEFVWRPFLLGPVFQMNGWTDSPFNLQKAKGAYMWRDMERECERYGVLFRKPSQFVRNGMKAARIATAAEGQSWQNGFIRETYLENFYHDRDIAEVSILADALKRAGCPDVEAALATADQQEVKDMLKARTQESIERGIFGAPSFFIDDELFFGNDRLDQAIEWATRHQ